MFWMFWSRSNCDSHSKQMAQPMVCASKCNPFITFIFKENQAAEVHVMFIKLLGWESGSSSDERTSLRNW